MKTVKIRNVTLGEGRTKICVPIVGVTSEEITQQAEKIKRLPADLVEWRADWFDDVFDLDRVEDILRELRNVLENIPILFTFRTADEGGAKEIESSAYAKLNKTVAATGYADLVDVELFSGDMVVKDIVDEAHSHGVKVVLSNHDFDKTPQKEEIVRRLCYMQELEADILKIAVMPKSPRDVLTLLAATEEMYRLHADRPLITMSMGGQGVLSRLGGEIFGSAVTFGSAGKVSAPGQIAAEEMEKILSVIHKGIL